jgi:hypothetical protein
MKTKTPYRGFHQRPRRLLAILGPAALLIAAFCALCSITPWT